MPPRTQLKDYLARGKHVSDMPPTLGERLDTIIDNAEKRHRWFNPTRDLAGQPPLVVALYLNRQQRREADVCEGFDWGKGSNSHEVEFNVAYEAYHNAMDDRKRVLASAWLDFLARHPTFRTTNRAIARAA